MSAITVAVAPAQQQSWPQNSDINQQVIILQFVKLSIVSDYSALFHNIRLLVTLISVIQRNSMNPAGQNARRPTELFNQPAYPYKPTNNTHYQNELLDFTPGQTQSIHLSKWGTSNPGEKTTTDAWNNMLLYDQDRLYTGYIMTFIIPPPKKKT